MVWGWQGSSHHHQPEQWPGVSFVALSSTGQAQAVGGRAQDHSVGKASLQLRARVTPEQCQVLLVQPLPRG